MRKLGQHNVDRAFAESLDGAEMPVSNRIWASIASDLEKESLHRKLFWYRSVAVASVFLLIGMGTWMLAWQSTHGDGRAFAGFGKPMKGWNLELRERACVPVQGEDVHSQEMLAIADVHKGKMSAGRIQTSPIKQGSASKFAFVDADTPKTELPALQEALKKAPAILAELRQDLQSKVPSLLPNLADKGKRPIQAIEIRDLGEFAGLIPPKSLEKRHEKEFSYTLDEFSSSPKAQKRWELGAGFAPDMTFASTTPLEQQARSSQIIANDPTQANTNRLSPVMAYSTSVRTSFELSDRWSLRTGVSYLNRSSSATATVNAYGKVDSYQSTLNLSSMEVPLAVRFNVIASKHFDYYVTSGISGTFLLHYDNTQVTTAGKITARRSSDAADVLKPSQGSVLLSTGLKYRIFDRLNLQVEPGLRYGLLTNEYAFSQTRPVSMNLMTGLNYHF